MKSTKRAVRRHHRGRMLQHALRSCVLQPLRDDDPGDVRRRALGWFNNLQKCSCYMCGNPRRHFGTIPVQERRLQQAARYEEAEFLAFPSDLPPLSE